MGKAKKTTKKEQPKQDSPKYNPAMCRKCKYHGKGAGYNYKSTMVHCNYANETRRTCLQMIDGQVVDTRGGDYNNCLLFEPGKPDRVGIRAGS